MNFGERLKTLRKYRKLTQKELGSKCDMPDSQIRKYESNNITPRLDTLIKLANALNVQLTDLTGETELEMEDGQLIRKYHPNVYNSPEELERALKEARSRPISTDPDSVGIKISQGGGIVVNEKNYDGTISSQIQLLNDKGKEEVIRHIGILSGNPDYKKEDDK